MEHWRFYVAILLLLILLRPIHEYFTEDDANRMNAKISSLESQVNSLNSIYKPTLLLDISDTLIDIDTKLKKLGKTYTVLAETRYDISNPKATPYNIPFILPVGKWLVTAAIVYVPTNMGSDFNTDSQIAVGFNITDKASAGYVGLNNYDHLEVARLKDRYTRFSISANIDSTDANVDKYLNIWDANGAVYVTIFRTQIGF